MCAALIGRRYHKLGSTIICHLRKKSCLGLWQNDINSEMKIAIEKHWRDEVLGRENRRTGDTMYVLSMFPYPSGQLHLGHVRVYSISDTIARFHRLNGRMVIHPMGWDAFGLPAENAAIERNVMPDSWTITNIKSMKEELLQLGFQFDWNCEVTTCKTDYYKWTQYIFLKLLEKGLVYRSKGVVNWDPVDKTVLADEQVDVNGCSWRSGAKVEKMLLNQWYIRTTKFAKQLYDGLDNKMLIDWKDITNLQKHWIGECDGITIQFSLKGSAEISLDTLDIWSSEPEKFLHGQFIVISPGSILSKELSKITVSVVAVNPINGKELPIFITDAVEYPDGRDVYIASPNTCSKDLSLAVELNLSIPDEKNETNLADCRRKVLDIAKEKNVGGHPVSSKLKDWLISRQRYWGTPIPIVHCDGCGAVPVPFEDLPVKLPQVSFMAPRVSSLPEDWLNCICPKCGSNAKRETDTMDTFVDSSWYFLRYLDAHNKEKPFDPKIVESFTPVDLYVGGKEHAVLHLYYARFMTHFLHSLGWTPNPEPFKRLLVQGMIMGKSYRVKSSGKYLPIEKVAFQNNGAVEAETGAVVETQWEKMSKSKYNGESPQNLLSVYGCDTTRLFILADVTPEAHRHWSEATFPGILNWQHRIWLTVREFLEHRQNKSIEEINENEFKKHEDKLWDARNYFTATTTYNFNYTYHLSVAISRLQGLTNTLRRVPPDVVARSKEFELALSALVIMLSPIAPHFCCELWSGLQSAPRRLNEDSETINWDGNVFDQNWPKVDDHYHLSFLCKVDGADRSNLKVLPKELQNMTHDEALKIMLEVKNVAKKVNKGISKTVFENYPGCRAILKIYTTHSQKERKIAAESSRN